MSLKEKGKDADEKRAKIWDNDQRKWVILDESVLNRIWPKYKAINDRERDELWNQK